MLKSLLLLLSITHLGLCASPNIIFIYADDMGIGDVSHNGGKAPTPHLDRMAKEGMRFTDAHSTSSVCTPSRYSALTGRYSWRTRLNQHVFNHPNYAPLIKPDEVTIQSFLKTQGYATAMVGKWHLGMEWEYAEDFQPDEVKKPRQGWDIDFDKPLISSPRATGFDYYWGIFASLDMQPYVYIENEKALYTELKHKDSGRQGPIDVNFKSNEVLGNFAKNAVKYIEEKANKDTPFFLYLPLTSPHSPVVPSQQWLGKSGISKYGDFLMETDWVVGEVLNTLDKHDIYKDTIVIFSADNGSSSQSCGLKSLLENEHHTNGALRGHKADIYEGGHRVPFLVTWPGVVPSGSVSDQLVSQSDILATCADLVESELPDHAGVDSVSFLPTLKNPKSGQRNHFVNHSVNGSFAIREGDWKLIMCSGSGGWSHPKPGEAPEGAPDMQLYNLADDLSETTNLIAQHPEKAEELRALLESFVAKGRSTEGTPQKNDREDINIGPNPINQKIQK